MVKCCICVFAVEHAKCLFLPDLSHAGCSLKLILDWAWDRVVEIKDHLDQLCKNLNTLNCVAIDFDTFKITPELHNVTNITTVYGTTPKYFFF